MAGVVGLRCALAAVVAACCAVPGDRLYNVAAGCAFVAQAGSLAMTHCSGPGSFVAAFLDALYTLSGEGLV